MINRARAQGDSRDQVRVFTIAYSAEAEGAREALTGIAKASGGQAYEGTTEDIETSTAASRASSDAEEPYTARVQPRAAAHALLDSFAGCCWRRP